MLRQAESCFARAKYLFISRHPVPCIESWIDLTKKNLALQNRVADVEWSTTEPEWVAHNQNIILLFSEVAGDQRA